MTAAAIASSSIMRPASVVAAPSRAVSTTPASPASIPMSANTPVMRAEIGTPE